METINMIIAAFIIGFLIGGFAGVITFALAVAAGKDKRKDE